MDNADVSVGFHLHSTLKSHMTNTGGSHCGEESGRQRNKSGVVIIQW